MMREYVTNNPEVLNGQSPAPSAVNVACGPDAPGYGLVLAGGGLRGGYQIGVWHALREQAIPITGVVGTSIGAINAAVIAMDDYERALWIWQHIELKDIIEVTRPLPVPENLVAWRNLPAVTRMIRQDHGLCTEPLRHLLTTNLDERILRDRGIPFGLLTYSLTERKPLALFLDEIPEGQLIDYILGSCALPYFKAMRIDGQRLIDGGVYNNRPTEMLVSRGWRHIIEVEIHGLGRVRPVNEPEIECIRIEPKDSLFGPFNFHPDARRERIRMGYADAKASLLQHGMVDWFYSGSRNGYGNDADWRGRERDGRYPATTGGSDSDSTGANPDRS